MPTTSDKQERFMQAVAHNPKFAKKAGVPQSVGKEFTKGPKKFSSGGFMNWVLGKKEEPKKAEPKEEPKKEEPKKFEGILKQGDTLSNPFKKMIENAGNPPPEKKAKGGPVKTPKKFDRGGLSEEREFDDPGISKLYRTYNEAITNRATKGKGKDAEEAYNRLQNMREEEIQARRGEQKRQRDERDKDTRQHMMKRDVEEANKKGKSYEKFFEDTRKDQLKRGALNKAAYDKGQAFELYTPEEIKSESPHAFKKGGPVKESKKMMGKELSFMKKKGAPKSMIKHEAAEMGKVAKYARGGGIERKGKTRGKMC